MVKAVGCNSVSRPKYAPEGYRRCKLCNGLVRKGRKCKCGRLTPEQTESQRLMDLERVRRCKVVVWDICEHERVASGPCSACGCETTARTDGGEFVCARCADKAGLKISKAAKGTGGARDGGRKAESDKRKAARVCMDCGSSIAHRGATAKRCEACQKRSDYERFAEKRRAGKPKRPETIVCIDCGAEWPNSRSGQRKRCPACAAEEKRRTSREYAKRRREEACST